MEIILISILSALSIVLGFAVFNLMKKNEQQEDILVEYMKYLNKISQAIEIGFFFKTVMTIQDLLNGFKIKDL